MIDLIFQIINQIEYGWLCKCMHGRWEFIQDGNTLHQDMDRFVAYEKALRTWARWVDKNVDPTKEYCYLYNIQ